MDNPLLVPALLIFTGIGAGTVGGAFFAFSVFVMKALTQVPPPHGALAMQRINVVVLNPVFLAFFVGTALLGLICVVVACLEWRGVASVAMLAGGALYLCGTFGVTVAFNVPRNETLAKMHAGSAEALAYWPQYVREWSFWNHVRTVAGIGSAACCMAAGYML